MSRHGFGLVTARLGLTWLVPLHRGWLGHARRDHPYSAAEHLRLALEELGTTAIKLGQIASTRPDLLPPEVIAELEKLRDRVAPVPTGEIVAIVERELGCAISDVFPEFDPVPLAAASIGQVHAARLTDGTPVVVKVRKPHVADTVAADLDILADLARRAAKGGGARPYDVEALADDLAWTLRREIDYVQEGRNADLLRSILAGDRHILVPGIDWAHTTKAVLVMDRVDGVPIGDIARLDALGVDRPALARVHAQALLTQALHKGFFHADPHQGNFLVLADGRIAVLDFGMVGRLDDELRHGLISLLAATVRQDAAAMTAAFEDLGLLRTPNSRRALRRDLRRLLDSYYGLPLDQFSLRAYVNDLLGVVRRQRLQLPTELALLLKTIAMSEGLWQELDPGFNASSVAQRFMQETAIEAFAPTALARRVAHTAAALAGRAAHGLTASELTAEGSEVTATLEAMQQSIDQLQTQVRAASLRVSMAALTAGLAVAAPVLAISYQPPGWWLIGPAWFLGVGVLGAALTAWLFGARGRGR